MIWVLAISLSFPVFLAYSHYMILAEADFLASNLKFENPDQENLSLHDNKKLIVLNVANLPVVLLSGPVLFEQAFHSPFNTGSLHLETAILRC